MGIGRTLIVLGAALVVLGLLFTLGDKLPIRLGRLPGDIEIRGKNSVFYFPVVTCILLSVVLSLVMWLFGRRS
jgi:ribose/xylose/arabinose/galactoside ABC-type transport system permease subunit